MYSDECELADVEPLFPLYHTDSHQRRPSDAGQVTKCSLVAVFDYGPPFKDRITRPA